MAPVIDAATVLSLLLTVLLLAIAYLSAQRFLGRGSPTSTHVIFIWHAFDAQIHLLLEAGYLWSCFCFYAPAAAATSGLAPADIAAAAAVGEPSSGTAASAAAAAAAGVVRRVTAPHVHFLADRANRYGPMFYQSSFARYRSAVVDRMAAAVARLWTVYGLADARWAQADPTVVSLEILTVVIGGPLALYICYSLASSAQEYAAAQGSTQGDGTKGVDIKGDGTKGDVNKGDGTKDDGTKGNGTKDSSNKDSQLTKAGAGADASAAPLNNRDGDAAADGISNNAWFWMIVLATGELYGGFMTFAPEWVTGSVHLDTSNWLYLWVYLVFFNGLWVVFPLWILRRAYLSLCRV